jgi:hypothetical protein
MKKLRNIDTKENAFSNDEIRFYSPSVPINRVLLVDEKDIGTLR